MFECCLGFVNQESAGTEDVMFAIVLGVPIQSYALIGGLSKEL